LRAFAFVLIVFSGARISADHQKVLACSEGLMTGACRQDDDIARTETNCSPFFAAKTYPRPSSCG
jgi:hypothetical protein